MPASTPPKLASAIMLADELAFHLMLEYLASYAPGFADYFCSQADRLVGSGEMPRPAEIALTDLREHVAFCAARH